MSVSQRERLIRSTVTRQGFIVDEVEWKPFRRSATQDADTGGWKVEATCKSCGLRQTFGGLSVVEVLYTIESISCILCQTLKVDMQRLIATYQPMTNGMVVERYENIRKSYAEGEVVLPRDVALDTNYPVNVSEGAHGDEEYRESATHQVFDELVSPTLTVSLRATLDAIPAISYMKPGPLSALHDFMRDYMCQPQSREPIDPNLPNESSFVRSTYSHWHEDSARGEYQLTLNPDRLRCSSCKAPCDPINPSWRMTGCSYEHKCVGQHPFAGYCAAELIEENDHAE